MSNLMIGGSCIQCGGCLGLGYDFLDDDGTGRIIVRDGTYLGADDPEFAELQEVCPVGAFSLDTIRKKKSDAEQLEEVVTALRSWEGIPEVSGRQDIPFHIKEYSVSTTADSPGAHSFKYSSESAALDAAEDEFDRIMYSKINTVILQILSEYRVKKLKPWFSMSEDDKSVYVNANNQVSEILDRAKRILGDRLPADFTSFDIRVANDVTFKMLGKGEVLGSSYVSNIREEFDGYDWTGRSHYRMNFDTMDREDMVEKKGLFGSSSYVYKTKYCYSGVGKACRELINDIKYAFDMKYDEIEESAAGWANQVVYVYNSRAKEAIQEKISLIEACLRDLKL